MAFRFGAKGKMHYLCTRIQKRPCFFSPFEARKAHREDTGHPSEISKADMAQLVEQRIRNAWVPGSSPGIGSKALR